MSEHRGMAILFVTPSRHRLHAQVMGLYLEIVTGTEKGFEIRIYSIWPFKIRTSLLNTNFHIRVFAKYTYNSKYKLENFTKTIPRIGIVLDSRFRHMS